MGSTNTLDDRLLHRLQNFTTRHTSHHRPVALVTSGGTAADLELNAVRFIDNFSTGLRGACAVEQFLKRGYAVVHLKRLGSVSPFGRIVEDVVSSGDGGRITFESLGELFDCDGRQDASGSGIDLDFDDAEFPPHNTSPGDNKRQDGGGKSTDPWLYSSENSQENDQDFDGTHRSSYSKSKRRYGELSLNPRLTHSHVLQTTLRSYKNIVQQGLLITITFRTVDEYLQKLQECCEALKTCDSLGLVYLACAVSDFYIPVEKRAVHKIQSRDYGLTSSEQSGANNHVGEDNTLTLTLYPVPKVIPTLRKEWCPSAFVISFKLETDASILRQKSVLAMERNGVHLVIGNELKTRYEKVFILSRAEVAHVINQTMGDDESSLTSKSHTHDTNDFPGDYKLTEVTNSNATNNTSNGSVDALEDATIEHVVRHHFYYISTQVDENNPNLSSVELFVRTASEANKQHQSRLQASYRQLQREKLKARMLELAWNITGSALGMAISYGIARMLQQRQQLAG
ncbi:hypothetical protein HJC23_012062 [Cyclotella cryptica]|uniref:DNA/pantothenate metabolism flavoprotein C-terminal domain-containing protein n=1 Tax=Cyclotella cryptica TaxID=29204 RepID=A0ABD3PTH3_9STRA